MTWDKNKFLFQGDGKVVHVLNSNSSDFQLALIEDIEDALNDYEIEDVEEHEFVPYVQAMKEETLEALESVEMAWSPVLGKFHFGLSNNVKGFTSILQLPKMNTYRTMIKTAPEHLKNLFIDKAIRPLGGYGSHFDHWTDFCFKFIDASVLAKRIGMVDGYTVDRARSIQIMKELAKVTEKPTCPPDNVDLNLLYEGKIQGFEVWGRYDMDDLPSDWAEKDFTAMVDAIKTSCHSNGLDLYESLQLIEKKPIAAQEELAKVIYNDTFNKLRMKEIEKAKPEKTKFDCFTPLEGHVDSVFVNKKGGLTAKWKCNGMPLPVIPACVHIEDTGNGPEPVVTQGLFQALLKFGNTNKGVKYAQQKKSFRLLLDMAKADATKEFLAKEDAKKQIEMADKRAVEWFLSTKGSWARDIQRPTHSPHIYQIQMVAKMN